MHAPDAVRGSGGIEANGAHEQRLHAAPSEDALGRSAAVFGLCDADHGNAERQMQVSAEAGHASRVEPHVSIDEDDRWRCVEGAKNREERRELAEEQLAGDVGYGRRSLEDALVFGRRARPFPEDGARGARAVRGVVDVDGAEHGIRGRRFQGKR
jgi:hypothetical protein